VVAAVISAGVGARAESGNALYVACSHGNVHFCAGYIAAIDDAARDDALSGHRACPPPGMPLGQEIDVVKRFLTAHPEKRHFSASSLVIDALAEAFPCRQ
jgi:hypothetical protein